MIQIKPFYYPQVLLLGNGLNRTYGSDSWEDLMRKIAVRHDLPDNLDCPYPLQAVLVTNDNIKQAMKKYKADFFGKTNESLRSQLQTLLSMNFDDILTTNYSYEIEAAALSQESVSEAYLKRTCKNIKDGKKAEPKYLLHSYQCIPFEEHENRIWHIHGEARKPNSMILGHYYYAALLHNMVKFVKSRGNLYRIKQEKNSMQPFRSWMDSFLLGDVYILGFGMDFSEFDMWWLLNRKKREKAEHGHVYFYEPGGNSFSEKEELLKLLDVEVVHCDMPKPHGTNVEIDKQYREFYQRAIHDIQDKTYKVRCSEENKLYQNL